MALFIILFVFVSPSSAFHIWSSDPPPAEEGETVALKCKADGYFEYCTWRKGGSK